MARWMAWLGAIGTSAGLACGGDTAGPEAGITVSLTVQPAFAEPGDTVRVTVTAVPTAGVAVAVIRVAASGLISKSDSVRVSGSGSQSFSQAYVLPFQPGQGSVSFVATAEGGGVTGTAQTTLQVSDPVPPKVSSVSATPSVQPDEWITVSYTAVDNVGLAWTVVRLTGAFTASYYLGGSNTIAPDGLSVYLGKDFGYLKLRASDGVLVEDVRVGLSFERLFALPGGLWLAGIAGDPTTGAPRLVLIDLR